MNEIRKFVLGQMGLKQPPQYFVLSDDEGSVIASLGADEEDAPGKIETALKAELAFMTGPKTYVLMAQDSGGAVVQRVKLRMHGTAAKTAGLDPAATVNGNLVQLVGKLSGTACDHFEKLYARQDAVIECLASSNKELAAAVSAYREAEDGGPTQAAKMAEGRLSRIIEVGLGAAVARLGGGSAGAAPGHPPAVSMAGKYQALRAFAASDLSDEEIDSIMSVVVSTGVSTQIMGCLSPENMSKAMAILQEA